MSVPEKENPNQYGDILLFGERRREREAVGDWKEDRRQRACTARPSVTKIPTGAGRWVPHVYPTVYLSHR